MNKVLFCFVSWLMSLLFCFYIMIISEENHLQNEMIWLILKSMISSCFGSFFVKNGLTMKKQEQAMNETSLKSQKFTWPLACVYISFAKLKNIFRDFFCLFKNLKDISMILHDFSCFIQDLECFIIRIEKNIRVLLHLKKYIQDFSRFFKMFHVLFKILNDIHVLSLIFMKYSRFFKIIYVLFKILNDFLFMYFIH